MRVLFSIFLIIHGGIHLLAFVKSQEIVHIPQIKNPIPKLTGWIWLKTFFLFIISSGSFLLDNSNWWILATAAVLVSQILIFQSWSDARYGTLINAFICIPIVISMLDVFPGSYKSAYKNEVTKRLATIQAVSNTITGKDLQHLPKPVQKYLNYIDALGKPKIFNARVVSDGEMKTKINGPWMDIKAKQYNFFGNRDADIARFFFISAAIFGVPFDGLHIYNEGKASMKIKAASLFQMVDASGPEMIQSENVTIFNDMCILAPATLIDQKHIQWEPIDDLNVKAKFTYNKVTITAQMVFNEKGELINFISSDRYLSEDGKKYVAYKWSTPVSDYKVLRGIRVATRGQAIWHLPQGDFSYAKFDIRRIEYNTQLYTFKY